MCGRRSFRRARHRSVLNQNPMMCFQPGSGYGDAVNAHSCGQVRELFRRFRTFDQQHTRKAKATRITTRDLIQSPLFQMYSNAQSSSSQYQMLRSATPAINRTTAEHMIALPNMTTSALRMRDSTTQPARPSSNSGPTVELECEDYRMQHRQGRVR